MKQLTDTDIENMAAGEFIPDDASARRDVRADLHLSTRIPAPPSPMPACPRLDLHQHTREQAWHRIMSLATSGARHAVIITGASGILHVLFPQWARESILAPYIEDFKPINNGSFAVTFRRRRVTES